MKKNLPKFVSMLLIISAIAFFYTQLTQVDFVEFYKKIDLLNRTETKEVLESGWSNGSIAEIENAPAAIRQKSAILKVYLPSIDTYFVKLYVLFGEKNQKISIYFNNNIIKEYTAASINKIEKFYCKLPQDIINAGFNKLRIVKEPKSPTIICTQLKIKNYYNQLKTPRIFILAKDSNVLSAKFQPPIKIFMAGIIVLLFLASYFLYTFAGKKILKTSLVKYWKHLILSLAICFIPFVIMYLISIFTPYRIIISSKFFFALCFLSIIIMQSRLIYRLILEVKLEDLVSFFDKILNWSLLKIDKISKFVVRKYLRLVQIISYKIPFVRNYYNRMQRKGVSLKKRQLLILISIFFLVLVNLVLFHKLPTAYFSGEDATFIIDASIANTPGNLSYLLYPKYGQYSRPFREVVSFLLYKLFGASPASFYSYHVLLQIMNTLLVFYCCFLFTKRKIIAFIAALLFSVLYCNYESVIWISAASMYQPLLLFYLLGFISFIKYKLYRKFKFVILSCSCYFLGLLSNQAIITLPIVLFLYDIMFYKDKLFSKNRLFNKFIYFFRTYLPYGALAFIFLFFIQPAFSAVKPRNLLHLTDFLWANIKALPLFIIPVPRMVSLSNFFTYKLHLRMLSVNSHLLPVMSFTFFLLIVWILVTIYRKKPEKSFGPKYILFPLLCLFVSYLPFTMTVLAGTHSVEGFIGIHRRFYTLPSVFFCILFAIFIFNAYNMVDIKNKVSGWKHYIPKAKKALIVVVVFSAIFYNFKSVLPLSGKLAKSTNDARRMLEKIKATYPEFPPESVICITGTEGQSPHTDIRYIKENLFLFYANPRNPNYIEELKNYNFKAATNFNKERRLYLYYTNLADVIVGTHTHLGGQRIFDNYFPILLPADERILIGLQKELYELDKTYFFEYNKKYDCFIVDTTQVTRKSLRPYLKTIRNLKPLVENFEEELITWIPPVSYEVESGIMKINSRERRIGLKSEDKTKNLFIEVIPTIYSQEMSIPSKLAYKVEVKMKVSPKSQEAISFPHVQLPVSKKNGLIPINKIRDLVTKIFEEDLAGSEYQSELKKMLLPKKVSVSSTFYNKPTPFLTQGVFDYKAKKLVDGMYGDAHSWKSGSASSWWKIDLMAPVEVRGVDWSRDRTGKSKSDNGFPKNYTIQTSLDDKDWVVVKEVKDYNPEFRGEVKIDTFKPITARYVKMAVSATINSQPVVIDEVDIISEPVNFINALRNLYRINQLEDKLQLIGDFNRFSHMQAYASSVYPGSTGSTGFQIKHLIDGKYGHEHTWSAPPGAGYLKNWIKIDLQIPTEINKIVWSGDRKGYAQNMIRDYTIQTSLDDKDWVVVKEVKDYNPEFRGEVKIDTFKPITARYVKMVINSTHGNRTPEIDEFEIIGKNFQYQTHKELIQKYKERFFYISNAEELKALTKTPAKGELSWITSTNESWDDESQIKSFDIISDGKPHTYKINISPAGDIEDIIKQFILEINSPPAEIEVEYIKIMPLKGEI